MPATKAQAPSSIAVRDDFYSSPATTVTTGTTVVWTNQGAEQHTVTSTTGAFNSGTLNPGQAQGLVAYRLLVGKAKKGHVIFNKLVPLTAARYDASARTLTLIPRRKLNLAQPERLTITASLLTDSLGRALDGDHDGRPGGDFVATLRGKSVTIAATAGSKGVLRSDRARTGRPSPRR